MIPHSKLERKRLRKILALQRGSQSAIAAELGVWRQGVSLWLQGKCESQRIAEAVQRKAAEILSARKPRR